MAETLPQSRDVPASQIKFDLLRGYSISPNIKTDTIEQSRDVPASQKILDLLQVSNISPKLRQLLEKEYDEFVEEEAIEKNFWEKNGKLRRQLKRRREMEEEWNYAKEIYLEKKAKKERDDAVFEDLAKSIQENEEAEEIELRELYGYKNELEKNESMYIYFNYYFKYSF